MQRGRKVGGELAALTAEPMLIQRPDAPYDLNDEEAAEWRRVVGAMPADYFGPETYGELANYCKLTVSCRRLSETVSAMQQAESYSLKELSTLMRLRTQEARAMSSLATRLRITKQATQHKDKVIDNPRIPVPWAGQ